MVDFLLQEFRSFSCDSHPPLCFASCLSFFLSYFRAIGAYNYGTECTRLADDRDRHRLGGAVFYLGRTQSGRSFAKEGRIWRRRLSKCLVNGVDDCHAH